MRLLQPEQEKEQLGQRGKEFENPYLPFNLVPVHVDNSLNRNDFENLVICCFTASINEIQAGLTARVQQGYVKEKHLDLHKSSFLFK